MSLLRIAIYPEEVLRRVVPPVSEITPEVRKLLDDMAETMYRAPGIGLAAPQVSSLLRAIVVDVGEEEETGRESRLYKLINPVVTRREGAVETEEGCLSIPGIREYVRRSDKVIVEGWDENGEPRQIEAEGLLSVCLQHEIDHLDGILFIDHLSRLKRSLIKKQLKSLKETAAEMQP